MSYTAEETSIEIVGITELVKCADSLVLATIGYHAFLSGSLKYFSDYFWSELVGRTFGYIVTSYEKGLTVMD
jgi:NAD(P)H-dependent FMN reductase